MDGTRINHHEWGILERTRYAFTDKWILAQKIRILKIQFTDHMKLKKNEEQNMHTSILLRRGNKIPIGEDTETKCRAETERKAIQRLLHLRIDSLYCYQTQTLLWMPRRACWKEPDMLSPERPCQSLTNTEADVCTQPLDWWQGPRVRWRTKEVKEFATQRKNNNINQPDPPP